jgi:hypothetical protein
MAKSSGRRADQQRGDDLDGIPVLHPVVRSTLASTR